MGDVRRRGRRTVWLGALAALITAVLIGAALVTEQPWAGRPRALSAALRIPPPTPSPWGETAASLGPQARAGITERLDDRLAEQPGRLSLSVQDLRTGATFDYGAGTAFSAASVIKVDLLVHMLLRAEKQDRFLTRSETDLAEQMIRYSDNDAADTAYTRNGFTPGFSAATKRLGLLATHPHPGGAWGAGTTTAADRLRLLRAVFTSASPLSERSREYVRSLLAAVAPEQVWGISAAAQPADTAKLKNGWSPAKTDGGLWIVHSTGHIGRGDREYLVAVLSDQHSGYGTGVDCVEDAVVLAVEEMEEALA